MFSLGSCNISLLILPEFRNDCFQVFDRNITRKNNSLFSSLVFYGVWVWSTVFKRDDFTIFPNSLLISNSNNTTRITIQTKMNSHKLICSSSMRINDRSRQKFTYKSICEIILILKVFNCFCNCRAIFF